MYKIFLFLIIFIVLIYFSKNIEPYQVNIDATDYPNNFCECIELWTTLKKAGKKSIDVYIKGLKKCIKKYKGDNCDEECRKKELSKCSTDGICGETDGGNTGGGNTDGGNTDGGGKSPTSSSTGGGVDMWVPGGGNTGGGNNSPTSSSTGGGGGGKDGGGGGGGGGGKDGGGKDGGGGGVDDDFNCTNSKTNCNMSYDEYKNTKIENNYYNKCKQCCKENNQLCWCNDSCS